MVSVWIVVIAVGEQGGGGKEGEICGFKHFLGWGRGWICGAMGGRVVRNSVMRVLLLVVDDWCMLAPTALGRCAGASQVARCLL